MVSVFDSVGIALGIGEDKIPEMAPFVALISKCSTVATSLNVTCIEW
jgi:hypothetical protein